MLDYHRAYEARFQRPRGFWLLTVPLSSIKVGKVGSFAAESQGI